MANEPLENDLKRYYARFDNRHDQLREQLISQLDQVARPSAPRRLIFSQTAKKALALAACLLIIFGGMYLLIGGDNSQETFAAAMNKFSQLQSIHLKMNTPGGAEDATLEMWWRRPHDFRMEYNGYIFTALGDKRYTFNPDAQTKLEIIDADGPGPEMLPLQMAGLDWLFAEDELLLQESIDKNVILNSEAIIYKGDICRKITCEKDDKLYEYIIDGLTGAKKQAPFYEVNVYGDPDATRLLLHMEVLEVDGDMPDDLFVIKPPDK